MCHRHILGSHPSQELSAAWAQQEFQSFVIIIILFIYLLLGQGQDQNLSLASNLLLSIGQERNFVILFFFYDLLPYHCWNQRMSTILDGVQ